MMVTPASEGLGDTTMEGGLASFRRMSMGDSEAQRRAQEDEVRQCASAVLYILPICSLRRASEAACLQWAVAIATHCSPSQTIRGLHS